MIVLIVMILMEFKKMCFIPAAQILTDTGLHRHMCVHRELPGRRCVLVGSGLQNALIRAKRLGRANCSAVPRQHQTRWTLGKQGSVLLLPLPSACPCVFDADHLFLQQQHAGKTHMKHMQFLG